MTVIETVKRRKLFQVAKELNLAHTTLMEFLNSNGYDTPKKHMSIVSQEMYEEIVKKFDQARWRKHLEAMSQAKEETKEKAAKDLRAKELDRILTKFERVKAEADTETLEKLEKAALEAEKEKAEEEIIESEKGGPTEVTAEIESPTIGEPPAEVEMKESVEIEEIAEKIAKEDIKPREMLPVDEVVQEALKLARRKPKKDIVLAEAHPEEEEPLDTEKKKKRRRRRKKPRRPEAPSPAAVDVEKERRAKFGKKVKESEEPEPKRKRRKSRRKKIDLKEVDASIKQTLAQIEDHGKGKRKKKRAVSEEMVEEEGNLLRVTEFISAQELANLMDINVTQIIGKAMEMGLLISINQRLDRDSIELIVDEFDYFVDFISSFDEEWEEIEEDEEAEKVPRTPVVTVMGHVDHGKTSLLDYIRKSNIIAGESGGITQHIGAYKVKFDNRQITFLDTPGHEAFTAMRARGAQVTDIVVLVVAADDQVMPQTVEAINHAQAAGVPLIIAINKIDKPNAQPEKVKQQLADRGILVEEWGGKYQCTEISAKYGQGVDKLMEEIILLDDMLELKAPVNTHAKGVIIDAKLDRGRGAIASILIQSGTLKVSDNFVCGQCFGKVRAMLDERSKNVDLALPSDPVQVLGFNGTPQASDLFNVIATEKEAKSISFRRQQLYREQSFRQIKTMTLDQISDRIKFGEINTLLLIIKGDVHGSVEALADALMKLYADEVTVEVIHKGVGAITESDVLLAAASGAVIIGFHVHANKKARDLAVREKVEIKSYRIIYDVIDDVKQAIEGLLRPDISEEIMGEAEIRDVFKISAVGSIAGCYVSDGKIERSTKVKIFREGVEIFVGEIESLKRFKDDTKEVVSGFECGIKVNNFNDIKVGDVVQAYKIVETKRTLAE